MGRIALALLTVCLVAAGVAAGVAARSSALSSARSWPMFHHDERHTGGVVAVRRDGQVAWENEFTNEGNVRGSPAVADIDGDGQLEVLLGVGCFGKLYAYDGATGREEWGIQVGPRLIASPSVGDLDGDGALEIVIASYDGKVYALGGS